MGSIFGNDKKADEKLVGVYIPSRKAHRLALYSALKGRSRTDILRELLNDFFSLIPSYEDILLEISKQIYEEWMERRAENLENPLWKSPSQIRNKWWAYRKEVKQKLIGKRLHKDIINRILNRAEGLLKNENEF